MNETKINVSPDMLIPGFSFVAPGSAKALYQVEAIEGDTIFMIRDRNGIRAKMMLPKKAVLNILNSRHLTAK